MDEQLLELMRDRFDRIHHDLSDLNMTVKEHTEMDAKYWKKIDQQEAQLSLIKWVGGSISISGVLGWFFSKFGH